MDLATRFASAASALDRFDESASLPIPEVLGRDVALLRFQLAFETIWKLAQGLAEERHALTIGSPKMAARVALQVGWLDEAETVAALKMSDDRNLIVHVYLDALANQVGIRLPAHRKLLRVWLERMRADWPIDHGAL